MSHFTKTLFTLSLIVYTTFSFAQLNPAVTSWIINNAGDTGYAGILSNVQQVQYSANNVYVSATCIPGYDIGPWTSNPNLPANQNFVYKITLNPQQNTGTLVNTPMGHIGVWTNGVSIFNAKDGFSYNSQGVWNRNAIVAEGISFDSCLGHPAPNGEYHHHLNPRCLYDDHDSSVHSPIIGYAFDGFPVYGAYGYANSNGSGGITQIKSSYRMRSITQRTSLPDGTVLSAAQYGPAVSSTYPLGLYLEDFEFVSGLGMLDVHNGRFCVTPEYPAGIYAYFVTLDSALEAAFPYTLGSSYYGTVQAGNTGPGSGHNVISEPVQVYTSVNDLANQIAFLVYPNPATEALNYFIAPSFENNMKATLYDATGRILYENSNVQSAVTYSIDLTTISAGMYFFKAETSALSTTKPIVVSNR